jgi:hypothetical protein
VVNSEAWSQNKFAQIRQERVSVSHLVPIVVLLLLANWNVVEGKEDANITFNSGRGLCRGHIRKLEPDILSSFLNLTEGIDVSVKSVKRVEEQNADTDSVGLQLNELSLHGILVFLR